MATEYASSPVAQQACQILHFGPFRVPAGKESRNDFTPE